jgi:hypothetical protein
MGILSMSLIEKAGLDSLDLILRMDNKRNGIFERICLNNFGFAKKAVSRRLDTPPVYQTNST